MAGALRLDTASWTLSASARSTASSSPFRPTGTHRPAHTGCLLRQSGRGQTRARRRLASDVLAVRGRRGVRRRAEPRGCRRVAGAALPPDWDMVFFGGMHRDEPVRVRENVLKLEGDHVDATPMRCAAGSTRRSSTRTLAAPSRSTCATGCCQERFNCYCFFRIWRGSTAGFPTRTAGWSEPWWLKGVAGPRRCCDGSPPATHADRRRRSCRRARRPPAPQSAYTTSAYRRLLNGSDDRRRGAVRTGPCPLPQRRCRAIRRRQGLLRVRRPRHRAATWDARRRTS